MVHPFCLKNWFYILWQKNSVYETNSTQVPSFEKFTILLLLISQIVLQFYFKNDLFYDKKYPNKLGRIAPVIFWFADRFEKELMFKTAYVLSLLQKDYWIKNSLRLMETLWDSLSLLELMLSHWTSLRLMETHGDSWRLIETLGTHLKPLNLIETHWDSLRLIETHWDSLRLI